MYYSPADIQERHAYIDRTIAASLEAFRDPEVVHSMGGLAKEYISRLSTAVVANIDNGEVQMPNEYKDDDEVLPIVAVHGGEPITVSKDFDRQTKSQKNNTLRKFKEWHPRGDYTANYLYDALIDGQQYSFTSPVITLGELTMALTGLMARILDTDGRVNAGFSNGPTKGLAVIRMKPALILKIDEDSKYTRAEDVAHELTHARRTVIDPVSTFHSQRSVDMAELRGELEAYHVGSVLTLHRYKKLGGGVVKNIPIDHGMVQMGVEMVRQKHGVDPLDPYRPSPALLRKLEERDLGVILHNKIDYNQFLDMYG